MAERCEYCRDDQIGAVEVSVPVYTDDYELRVKGDRLASRFPYCIAHISDAMRAAGEHLARLRALIEEQTK